MKLLTKEIEKKLEKFPLYSQDGKGLDAKVLVKFFGGSSATWLVTEAEKEGNNWRFFGYVNLGWGWEWGYFMYSELASLKFPPFGLGVEREIYGCRDKVRDYVKEAC